jgi:hypothetical protein
MSHIALRTSDAEGWMFAQSTKYGDEDHLRNLIWDEPSLMPMSEMGLPTEATMIPLKETSLPGAGSSDVILVDSLGNIVIVECKLAKNPEKKRAVIGQVLDYASSLATMSYDDLNDRVAKEHNRPLHELMEERVPAEEWDEDQFRFALSETLASGGFTLAIAIDEMDTDLARILHYIPTQGELRIFGLELRYHKQNDVEVIIPHIANPVDVAAARSTASGQQWDADSYKAELGRIGNEKVRAAAIELLRFGEENAESLSWGRSGAYGSFAYRIRADGKQMSLFNSYTTEDLYVNLEYLKRKASPELFEDFVNRLASLRGFGGIDAHQKYPRFKFQDTLVVESTMAGFKEAVLALQRGISDS